MLLPLSPQLTSFSFILLPPAVIMFKKRFCGDQAVIDGIGEGGEQQNRKCSTGTE
jgi:hypothetical protein